MKQKRNLRRLWYFLLIPAVAVLLTLIFGWTGSNFWGFSQISYVLHAIALTSGIWIGCMILVDYLWVKFPWEKTPLKHLVLEIIFVLVYTNVFFIGLYLIEIHFKIFEPDEDLYLSIVVTNLITFLITAIHEANEFYKQWVKNFSKSVRLEKDNIEAKYEALKTQVNPHFLFNSLNSLVTMVEDKEEAVNYISNLSDFLRYTLKSRDRQLVLVRDEITMLKQYIELQKSRFKDNLQFELDVDEKFYHFSLPPLVLQMLVENCIKHNIVSKDKPLTIKIIAGKDWITVENNLQKKNDADSTGHGLQNISERYRFFTAEQVKIHETSSIFRVSVPLLQEEL